MHLFISHIASENQATLTQGWMS
jgi:hypothetical protein